MSNHKLMFISATSILSHLHEFSWMVQDVFVCLQECTVISGDQPAGLAVCDSFLDATDIGRHDRKSCSHGFDNADGEALPIAQQKKQIILRQ